MVAATPLRKRQAPVRFVEAAGKLAVAPQQPVSQSEDLYFFSRLVAGAKETQGSTAFVPASCDIATSIPANWK